MLENRDYTFDKVSIHFVEIGVADLSFLSRREAPFSFSFDLLFFFFFSFFFLFANACVFINNDVFVRVQMSNDRWRNRQKSAKSLQRRWILSIASC